MTGGSRNPSSSGGPGTPAPREWRNATASTWRSFFGEYDEALLSPAVLEVDADVAARRLLGSVITSDAQGEPVSGVIVETEAYLGPHDPASHAAERIGRTARNDRMFGPPGTAYVYRSYGVHWCLNVVTGTEGFPAAVLIRGVDPISGREAVIRRRGGKEPLCAGPGRVTQALGVRGDLDGHPLTRPPLRLHGGWKVPAGAVGVSGRVGIRLAADWPLRFYLSGHPQVTPVGHRKRHLKIQPNR